jgi:hypothetical protein
MEVALFGERVFSIAFRCTYITVSSKVPCYFVKGRNLRTISFGTVRSASRGVPRHANLAIEIA